MTAYEAIEIVVVLSVFGLIASLIWQTVEIRRSRLALEEQRKDAINSIEFLLAKLKAAAEAERERTGR